MIKTRHSEMDRRFFINDDTYDETRFNYLDKGRFYDQIDRAMKSLVRIWLFQDKRIADTVRDICIEVPKYSVPCQRSMVSLDRNTAKELLKKYISSSRIADYAWSIIDNADPHTLRDNYYEISSLIQTVQNFLTIYLDGLYNGNASLPEKNGIIVEGPVIKLLIICGFIDKD